MTFLHPLALAGLAAAAIPALLHLLQRRTPPEVEFPALRYLTEAERRSARRLRLRHVLLLLLRTGLIAALALAAARPLVPARAGGAHQATALVVILDNSPSAGAVVAGRPVLDRLRVIARASLGGAAPGDRLWLMLADGVLRSGSREALLAAVDSAAPAERRLDLVDAVTRAARVVDAEPLPGREVHVVTDLQRTALSDGRADVPSGVLVLALGPTGPAATNRGLAAVDVLDGAVRVSVAGTAGVGAGPLVVTLGGRPVARTLAQPGATLTLPLPLTAPGWWVGEAVLDPDDLRADDRRPFVRRVAPPARVTATAAGPFVAAALAVLRDAHRVADGGDVSIGERPAGRTAIVFPPADAALTGAVNRALAGRGSAWTFAGPGTPGVLASQDVPFLGGVAVARRARLVGPPGDTSSVLATVNGEPWLVRSGEVLLVASRLDTAWTALPSGPAFVPFVDALVNRVAAGAALVTTAEGSPHVEFRVVGGDTVGATVYGPDPRESDLTPADAGVAARALGARVLSDAAFAAARFTGTRRADLSGLLLVLALCLAGAELGVASVTR
ncbi:MAG TPA: BatA domain-containing protein [Gemmatimonadales bacterium]